MKLRINEKIFEHRIYELEIINGVLLFFSSQGKEIRISVSDLKQITLDGNEHGFRHFILESKQLNLDGNFLCQQDGEKFIHLLQKETRIYQELRMEF